MTLVKDKRSCFSCTSQTTSLEKTRKGTLIERWYPNYDAKTGELIGCLCSKCFGHYINNPIHGPRYNPKTNAKWNKLYSGRYVKVRDKRVILKENPKVGVCNFCRGVVPFDCHRTSMHHEYYDQDNPLKGAIECCDKCHRKQHKRHLNGTFNSTLVDLT